MRNAENTIPATGIDLRPVSLEDSSGNFFPRRRADTQVHKYANDSRKTEVAMSCVNPPMMLAIRAEEQIIAKPARGTWDFFDNLEKEEGKRPSTDMAYANLDVPMVPDSSAPRIETKAPTPTMANATPDRPRTEPKIDDPASNRGLFEWARVDWSTTPTTTKLVAR